MPCTVFDTLESRNLQQIAILCIDRTNYFVDECRIVVYNLFIIRQVSPCRINSQLVVFATTVNSCIVFVYNIFTLLAIRLHDEFLHLFDSQINRNYACDTEECRLQDCIGTVTQTNFQCDLCSVDIINCNIFLSKITFYAVRQMFCQLFTIPYSVQQECTVLTQTASHIVHTQVSLNVASYEIRCVYQIGRTDRMITETQVRTSETTRFLRVVREISLAIFICIVTDDLNRVLVGTDSTVCTQTVELSFEHTFATQCDLFFLRQGGECYVIYDTDRELVLRHRQCQVFIYGKDLGRSRILRTQTITAAYDNRSIFLAIETVFYIQIQRFAYCTRFFCTVQNSNTFSSLRNSCQEVFS